MDDLSPVIFWNIILTLVYAPLIYSIRQNANELKRIDILVNKTREEVAKEYVTKDDLEEDLKRIFDYLGKLDGKIDKLIQS
jgi:hypothetical protein|tara:strand:- start:297 stop:539 length:243 start_codon:yes stop_codon:yes gene_type:complete